MDEIASYVGSVNYIKKGKNGEDAIFYEIVPSTLVVSLDADGNWVSGTPTMSDGSGMAGVPCTAYMVKNGVKTLFSKGYWLSDHNNTGYASPIFAAQVAKTDSSVNVSLLKSAPTSDGAVSGANVLARISISVNRAGKNGASVSIQYSADGASGWKDAYFAGAKYIRIYSNGAWSSAMKIVGDDGTSFLIKGSFSSKEGLPTSGAAIGDAYLIGGDLWVYVAYAGNDTTKHYRGFENIGNIQGPKGDSVTVKSTEVFYGISASGTDPSTVSSWASSVQDITADKPYLWTKTVVTFSDGKSSIAYSVTTRGNRGAIFRQHTAFEASGYEYQSGSGAEEFIDVIATQTDDGTTRWFRCMKSYNSKDNPAYDDLSKADVWNSAGMQMKFVATDFFLAKNAKINMLGSNEINLYGDDNKMFASFRVPHGNTFDGGDEGEYALWVGAEGGENASFSVTKDGKIKADSGNIGPFVIQKGEKFSTQEGLYYGEIMDENRNDIDKYYTFGFSLCKKNLSFGISGDNVIFAQSGYCEQVTLCKSPNYTRIDGKYYVSLASPALDVVKKLSDYPQPQNNIAAKIEAIARADSTCTGLQISASGGAANYALECLNGDIQAHGNSFQGALRPIVRKVSSSTTLSDEDCIVVCTNTSVINLTLPSGVLGRFFIVIQAGARVNFRDTTFGSRGILCQHDPNSDLTYQWNMLVYDGANWHLRGLWNKQ